MFFFVSEHVDDPINTRQGSRPNRRSSPEMADHSAGGSSSSNHRQGWLFYFLTRSMINNERQIFWTRRVRYFRAK